MIKKDKSKGGGVADVNKRLLAAAESGSEAEVKALLLDPGCDALAADTGGMTALMGAALYGQESCTRLLLPASDAGAKSNGGLTALMWAAFNAHEDCVRILLPASDVLARDNRKRTALILAAYTGSEACVSLLLPVSDALAEDKDGLTASAWAQKRGHETLAQFIDAYTHAQSAQSAIGEAVAPGAPRGRATRRV